MKRDFARLLFLFVGLLSACNYPRLLGPIGLGAWGNADATLTVGADSSKLEVRCVHGVINGRLAVSTVGTFDLTGTLTFDHGGPVAPNGADKHPARFSGFA